MAKSRMFKRRRGRPPGKKNCPPGLPVPLGSPSENASDFVANPIEQEQLAAKALELRASGMTEKQVGEQLGYSRTRARQLIDMGLEKVRDVTIHNGLKLRKILLERYDHIYEPHAKRAAAGDDKSAAICLRINEQVARLTGVNAPEEMIFPQLKQEQVHDLSRLSFEEALTLRDLLRRTAVDTTADREANVIIDITPETTANGGAT
jgi:hypothetical protein